MAWSCLPRGCDIALALACTLALGSSCADKVDSGTGDGSGASSGGGGSGSGPAACTGNPDFTCTEPWDCEADPGNCGPLRVFDTEGCLRLACDDHGDCPAGQKCYRAHRYHDGYSSPSSIGCFEGSGGGCECISTSDNAGRFCVDEADYPGDVAEPEACAMATTQADCEAVAFAKAEIEWCEWMTAWTARIDGDTCSFSEPETYCVYWNNDEGDDMCPESMCPDGTSMQVYSFALDDGARLFESPHCGPSPSGAWDLCEFGDDRSPPACSCACDPGLPMP